MVYILIIAMLVGIYEGLRTVQLTHSGVVPGIRPSQNLINFMLLDKRQ